MWVYPIKQNEHHAPQTLIQNFAGTTPASGLRFCLAPTPDGASQLADSLTKKKLLPSIVNQKERMIGAREK